MARAAAQLCLELCGKGRRPAFDQCLDGTSDGRDDEAIPASLPGYPTAGNPVSVRWAIGLHTEIEAVRHEGSSIPGSGLARTLSFQQRYGRGDTTLER